MDKFSLHHLSRMINSSRLKFTRMQFSGLSICAGERHDEGATTVASYLFFFQEAANTVVEVHLVCEGCARALLLVDDKERSE